MHRNTVNIFRTKALAMALLVSVLCGCTAEDWSKCRAGLEVAFSFVHNPTDTERFSDEVTSVDVYVFDADGYFVQKQTAKSPRFASDYRMNLELGKSGTYTIVAVGNMEREFEAGHTAGHLVTRSMVEGDSRLDDYRLVYGCLGQVSDERLTTIFHGVRRGVQVSLGKSSQCKVELIKNTKTLDIRIKKLDQVVPTPGFTDVELKADGINSTYYYDNGIDTDTPVIKYFPYTKNTNNTDLNIEMSVLRLTSSTTLPLDISRGGATFKSIELISEIMKSPTYSTDSDLDREDTFLIEITFETNGSVTIDVNGWTTTDSGGNIG